MSEFLRVEIMRILQVHKGRENAIHRKTLLVLLAPMFPDYPLPDLDRKMRGVIEEEGPKGEPMICSCPKGYYLASTPAEAKEAVRFLNKYIGSLAKRRSAILKHYPEAAEGVQGELSWPST